MISTLDPPADQIRERFTVHPDVAAAFPEARIGILVAEGLVNTPSDDLSRRAQADAIAGFRQSLEGVDLREHPNIRAWHDVYRRFGAKPNRHPCSAEALAQRALKSRELPAINSLVDLYNSLSVTHLTPIGGEDLDQLDGTLVLRFSCAGERFDIPDDPSATEATLPAGEVVWTDRSGVTCRRWNWRQGRRTRLTETTRRAYFVVEMLQPPQGSDAMNLVLGELAAMLKNRCPAASVCAWTLPVPTFV